jgi:hypothetical protein
VDDSRKHPTIQRSLDRSRDQRRSLSCLGERRSIVSRRPSANRLTPTAATLMAGRGMVATWSAPMRELQVQGKVEPTAENGARRLTRRAPRRRPERRR